MNLFITVTKCLIMGSLYGAVTHKLGMQVSSLEWWVCAVLVCGYDIINRIEQAYIVKEGLNLNGRN